MIRLSRSSRAQLPRLTIHGRGLTLTEVLVTITLLGLLGTGFMPAVATMVGGAQDRDAGGTLMLTWTMARAYALERQEPVSWHLFRRGSKTLIRLETTDGRNEVLREIIMADTQITVRQDTAISANDAAAPLDDVAVTVAPHGLTQTLTLEVTRLTRQQTVILPAAWDGPSEGGLRP